MKAKSIEETKKSPFTRQCIHNNLILPKIKRIAPEITSRFERQYYLQKITPSSTRILQIFFEQKQLKNLDFKYISSYFKNFKSPTKVAYSQQTQHKS